MWKKSEVWKSRGFRCLILLEIILLIAGCIGLIPGDRVVDDLETMAVSVSGGSYREQTGEYEISEDAGYQESFLTAAPQALAPGVYRLEIDACADSDATNVFGIKGTSGYFRRVRSNTVSIYAGTQESTCQFYVTGKSEEAVVTVTYGSGTLTVGGIRIVKTNAGSRIFLTGVIFLSLLADTLVMLYFYMGRYPVEKEKKLAWFGIPAIALTASIPVFTDYNLLGVDYIFHCMRIEALAKSICQGALPTRIEAVWMAGHGYANSIFYCDTFLTFPALLRLLGFDVTFSYNAYIVFVNLMTALIAYISFRGIFRNGYTGVFGSLLYTLAPYRVYNIYNRSAVGEFTAMSFLPLLAWGFYMIFAEDDTKPEYRYCWLIPALGFSGIIQSHLLTCEIAGAYVILLCLIMIKKVFRRKTFAVLAKTVAATLLLNLWYLVPLADMMLSGEYYYSNNTNVTVQKRGILLANIFDTMQSAGSNSKFYELGLQDTEPIGVGMAVLLALFAWALSRRLLRETVDKKRDAAAKIAFLVGVVGLVMSTAYFPWDAIQSLNRVTGTLVPMIQFTTRLTMIPVICLTFVAAEAADRFLRAQDKVLRYGFFVLVCGASVVFSLYQMDSVLLDRDGIIRIYSAESISGTIRTWYSGKWYWRACEAVSAVTFVLLLASASIRYRKRRHMQV